MNKKSLLIPLLAIALGGSGCSPTPTPTPEPTPGSIKVESVSLNESSKTIEVGDTFTLSETVLPENATNKSVTWSTSAENVAKVENGKVTAISAGTANITVKTVDQEKTAVCVFTIKEKGSIIHVTEVKLDKTDITLTVGNSSQITATVLPENATNKNVSWESSDESVAKVNNGVIAAISEGFAEISVKTEDSDKTAACQVTVTGVVPPEPEPQTITKTINSGDMFSKDGKIDETPIEVTPMSFEFKQNDGSTQPAYVKDSTTIRLYPKNTMKISSSKGKLVSITLTFGKNDVESLGVSTDSGTYKNGVWSGSASNVTFTIADATGGRRSISKFEIKYEGKEPGHDPIDLGEKTIKEVKDYIAKNPVTVNSHGLGVDENTKVTIKGYAIAKLSLIKTAAAFGLNVSEPNKVVIGDATDAIAVATKTGDGTLFNKVDSYQMKETSKYTITGVISIYLGQPELLVSSFTWDKDLKVDLDIAAISKANISITEFYTKASEVNYNCAGHGYGETYTLKGLTCYYDESAGQGKDWYQFTDGTNNIRVNAYNLNSISVGSTYDVTGIISLLNYSPIIVAFELKKSTATPVNLEEFYKNAAKTQSITTLLTIKGSQEDTDIRYPNLINSYSQISKVTGYLCIVQENGKLYVGVSDKYLGKDFLTGKLESKTAKGVALIKNDNFWNTTEEKLALYNYYYADYMCEDKQVDLYYINRQLEYKNSKPGWEILLIPQSIPAIEK